MRLRSSTHSGDQLIKPYRVIMSVLWTTKAALQTDTTVGAVSASRPSGAQEQLPLK